MKTVEWIGKAWAQTKWTHFMTLSVEQRNGAMEEIRRMYWERFKLTITEVR